MEYDKQSLLKTKSRDCGSYERIPNPYKLSVIQKIYDDYSIANVSLKPTDLYVCFKPQDSTQFISLINDYELELFDYPLDIVLEEGEEYVNPELGEDELNWFYTTVKPDFAFPENIPHQVIDTCYIPSPEESIPITKGQSIDVETIALGRCGLIDTTDVTTKSNSAIYPSGRIQVIKDTVDIFPVKGVKIRCHNVVKWATCYTDMDGNYTMSKSFKSNVHYAVVFDNIKGFDIWGNRWPVGKANYNMGWHRNSGYSKAISTDSNAWEWAVVNNTAYAYYQMCDSTGISKPPQNLKIWVWKNYSMGSAPMLRRIDNGITFSRGDWVDYFSNLLLPVTSAILTRFKLILPDVIIGTKNLDYFGIYERVCHELFHASHFTKAGSEFWTKYINYIITYGCYGDGTGYNSDICGIGEMWAYAMGEIQAQEFKYGVVSSPFNHNIVDNWIHPKIIWDIYTTGLLSKKEIFDCLSPDVDTYDRLINKLTETYPDKKNDIIWHFIENEIIPSDVDVQYCPDINNIELGTAFDIKCAHTSQDTLDNVRFRLIKEKYFDGESSQNITIQKDATKKYLARVTISDYGYYIIEASVDGSDYKRYYHVAKHYKPSCSLPIEVGNEYEPVTNLGTQIEGPYEAEVSFGQYTTLHNRIVAIRRLNYLQTTTGNETRKVDKRHAFAESDTLKFTAGNPSTIQLPDLYNYVNKVAVYDPVDTITESRPQTIIFTTYSRGYYAIYYPQDISYWVN
ncbi:MAG: hypothetical protein PUC72_01145 [Bacteroidales bacterium]|nr:hypothetical protein [Bacteroidales bacterium]